MARTNKQLTFEYRCQIKVLKSSHMSNRAIGKLLVFSSSTIDRELKRNRGLRGYRPKQAQEKAQFRSISAKSKPRKMTPSLIAEIEWFLTEFQWSPEQICGVLKTREANPISLSPETIYQHIIADKAKKGMLYLHLRRKSRKYQNRVKGKTTRGQISNRVGIEHRPIEAEKRERLGDFEADTVIGKGHKSTLVTMNCRKSRFIIMRKVTKKTAELVKNAIISSFEGKNLPIHTVTFDNGKEFAYHEKIADKLGVKTYFADPYSSWQRGTNENSNGLVRQYFPKKTDFAKVSEDEVERVQNLLNNRPRKILNYKTPNQVYHENG
jgi:transposase, IS30 family